MRYHMHSRQVSVFLCVLSLGHNLLWHYTLTPVMFECTNLNNSHKQTLVNSQINIRSVFSTKNISRVRSQPNYNIWLSNCVFKTSIKLLRSRCIGLVCSGKLLRTRMKLVVKFMGKQWGLFSNNGEGKFCKCLRAAAAVQQQFIYRCCCCFCS